MSSSPLLRGSIYLFALVLPLLTPARLGALPQGPLPRPDRPTAYLVTIGPGDAIWERFGHNLIWIHDPGEGPDEGYNYGLFSFEQEGFVVRFLLGEMRYWMEGLDIRTQLRAYAGAHRSIWIQELALGIERVRELQAFLEWNERPENRFYRYDYYRDNCSTRVRDALDRALDGGLREWARGRSTTATYRDHTLRQTAGLFWASVGMHFGLGPRADRRLSAWEAMFLPMELQDHLRSFEIHERDGTAIPLVRGEWTYYEADRPPTPRTTPRWIGGFALAGLGLAGLIAFLTVLAGRERARAILAVVAVTWLGLVGLLGLLVALLWGLTDHVYTHGNVNLFYANPLMLVLAVVVVPRFAGHRWAGAWVPPLVAVAAGLTAVGILVETLAAVGQMNGEFVALLAPVNLALAWSFWRLQRAGDEG